MAVRQPLQTDKQPIIKAQRIVLNPMRNQADSDCEVV